MDDLDLIKQNQNKMIELLVLQENERDEAEELVHTMFNENMQLKSFVNRLQDSLKQKDSQIEDMKANLTDTNLKAVAHQQKAHELECKLKEYEGLNANLIVSKQKEFNEIIEARDQDINVRLIRLRSLLESCESLRNFYQINMNNLTLIENKINSGIIKLETRVV